MSLDTVEKRWKLEEENKEIINALKNMIIWKTKMVLGIYCGCN